MPGKSSTAANANAPIRPALQLLPGGKSPRANASKPKRTPVSALPSKPRMAARLRLIGRMIGVDPDTPSGSAAALRFLRVRQLSAARSVTRPKRTPLPSRDQHMNVTFWEVFGRFGRRASNTVSTLLRSTRKRLHAVQAEVESIPESTIPAAAVQILTSGTLRHAA